MNSEKFKVTTHSSFLNFSLLPLLPFFSSSPDFPITLSPPHIFSPSLNYYLCALNLKTTKMILKEQLKELVERRDALRRFL